MEKEYKISGWLIFVLAFLLLLAVSYIAIDKYKEQRELLIQSAMQYGYEQAILDIMEEGENCNTVPLYYGNETMEFIAVDCLNFGEAQE